MSSEVKGLERRRSSLPAVEEGEEEEEDEQMAEAKDEEKRRLEEEDKRRRREEEDEVVGEVKRMLRQGIIPPLFIDPTSQDILMDPVVAEDGFMYSRDNILNWIALSKDNALLSPITGKAMGPELQPNVHVSRILKRMEEDFKPYRKHIIEFSEPNDIQIDASSDSKYKKEQILKTSEKSNRRPLLSLCQLAAIYEQLDNYLVVTLSEKHPNWRVPQLAVLGLAGVGKSSLLERLLMISVFPCRSKVPEGGLPTKPSNIEEDEHSTFVPVHVKMRHVHKDLAATMPPVVIRVIDTNKKVQIADAKILPCYDSAHLELERIMKRLRQEEAAASSSRKRISLLEAIEEYGSSGSELPVEEPPPTSSASLDDSKQQVGLNRAVIVHIYSPLVPTLNLVDLPGLLPTPPDSFTKDDLVVVDGDQSRDNAKKISTGGGRSVLQRSDSSGSLWASRRNSSRSNSVSSVSSTGTAFSQTSTQRRASFNQRQTWSGDTAAERRLEITERYILSYPDSLYLLLIGDTPYHMGKRIPPQGRQIDPVLVDLIEYYELESRTIGVLAHTPTSAMSKSTPLPKSFGKIDASSAVTSLHERVETLKNELPLRYGYAVVSLKSDMKLVDTIARDVVNTQLLKYAQLTTNSRLLTLRNWRYVSLVQSAHRELELWAANSDDTGQFGVSFEGLTVLINRAYLNDLKLTWIPLALQELFLEKDKLDDMNADLGYPLPPSSSICCPKVLYREFNINNVSPNESLSAMLACFDNDEDAQFIGSLLSTVRDCLTYDQYMAHTRHFGVSILNSFLEEIENLKRTSSGENSVMLEGCLNPDKSINQSIKSVQNEVSVLCERCLIRMKAFWGQAVRDILFGDVSSFKLQRFPQVILFVQKYLDTAFEDNFQSLPEQWNQVLDDFFDVALKNTGRGDLDIVFAFTPFESLCKATWNGKKLANLLLSFLVTPQHLISFHQLQIKVYEGVEHCIRHLDSMQDQFVEEHSDQRLELDRLENIVEKSIQGVLSICVLSGGEYFDNFNEENNSEDSEVSSTLSPSFPKPPYTLESVGLDIMLLKNNGFSPCQLRKGGFGCLHILRTGCSIPELREGGYNLPEGAFGGFTLKQLRAIPDPTALLALIKQLIEKENATMLTLVESGFRLDELQAAGFDILSSLTVDGSNDSADDCRKRAVAALALDAAVRDQSAGEEEIEALLDDDVVLALLEMLEVDNRLDESCVTEAKCSAASAIESICLAAATVTSSTTSFDDDTDNSPSTTILDHLVGYLIEHSFIPLMMNIFHSCIPKRKWAAQQSLNAFCVTPTALHALATAAAIEPLVEQLLHGTAEQRGWAALALCRFSSERNQAHASAQLVDNQCVEGLVKCLNHHDVRYREASAKALSNLASDDADMRFIASKGAIHALVDLLDPNIYTPWNSDTPIPLKGGEFELEANVNSCVTALILTLRNLVNCEKNVEMTCAKTSAVEHLARWLDGRLALKEEGAVGEVEWNVAEAAASALGGLAYCKESKIAIAFTDGAAKKLVRLVHDGSDSCCEAALWLLGCLACELETSPVLIHAQVMECLVATLRRQQGDRSDRCLAAAAWCLRYFTGHLGIFESEELTTACLPVIPFLTSLLSPPPPSLDSQPTSIPRVALQAAVAWALCSIASDLRICMQIVDAGAIWPLFRLLRQCHDIADEESEMVNSDADAVGEAVSCKEAIISLLQNIGHYELRQAGLSLQHLRDNGVTVSVLAVKQRLEGASAYQLAKDGFSYSEISEAGYSLLSPLLRPSEYQEDAINALVVLLQGNNCDKSAFISILQADLLGGIRSVLHNNTSNRFQSLDDIQRVRQKAVELIPLLVTKGISCPALLVHSGVLAPLMQMLALAGDSAASKCLAAKALASLSTASSLTHGEVGNGVSSSGEMGDDLNFHEMLLNEGALQLLVDMLCHSSQECRLVAAVSLQQIIFRRSCGALAIHTALENSVKSIFTSNEDAAQNLVDMLVDQNGGGDAHVPVAPVDILYLLSTHPQLKKKLRETGIVLPLLKVLRDEILSLSSPKKSPSKESHRFAVAPSTIMEKAISLLRQVSWYHTSNLLLIVENEGLEIAASLLSQLRLQPSTMAEIRKADLIWILNGVIVYGAPILLSVGCVEELMYIIFRETHSLVLEAALTVINELIEFDSCKYRLRTLCIAAQVDNVDDNQPSLSVGKGEVETTSMPFTTTSDSLKRRAQEIARGAFSAGCRSTALAILRRVEQQR